jgi:uncharacterized protein YndB with AHSA1/START domain
VDRSSEPPGRTGASPVRFRATRVVPGPLERVWSRWTTAEGLEAWWGARDVVTKVRALEVRPGGRLELEFEYGVVAGHPEREPAFAAAGVPTRYVGRGTFSEVVYGKILAFDQVMDFGPPFPTHRFEFRLEIRHRSGSVELEWTAETAANEHWTTLGPANVEGQLDRLVEALQRPTPDPANG